MDLVLALGGVGGAAACIAPFVLLAAAFASMDSPRTAWILFGFGVGLALLAGLLLGAVSGT